MTDANRIIGAGGSMAAIANRMARCSVCHKPYRASWRAPFCPRRCVAPVDGRGEPVRVGERP